jgi:soluble lytic murein transglycosylase-like protein
VAPLTRILAAAALALAAPVEAQHVARWRAEIALASVRCGVPSDWIEQVMHVESGGRTMLGERPIRSPKSAIGLMQLMPETWAEMRAALALGADPDDPRDNIVAGACYLRRMYDRFGYPGLFGAYNAGPGRYAAWLAGRQPLPAETVAYLGVVASPTPSPAPVPLFFVQRAMPAAAAPAGAARPGLFAIRRDVP